MRIRRLDLLAFGPFEGKTLCFEHDGSVEIVFGANEAGKSTTRRAILGLLFGIPVRSQDGWAGREARVGAMLVDGSAPPRRVEIVRRKGAKNTLLSPGGEPVEESVVRGFLGGVDLATFELAYGLDHAALRKGGAALKLGHGEVGESLFAAATGLVGLRHVLQEERRRAEALFVPKATQRPLNEALRAFAEAKKRTATFATSAATWVLQQRQVEEVRAGLEALRAERAELGEARAFAQAAVVAAREQAQKRARLADAARALDAVRHELGSLPPSEELLVHASRIAELQERLGSYRDGQAERAQMRAERDRSGVPPEGVEIPAQLARSAQRLGRESEGLRERARLLDAREAQARHTLATSAPSGLPGLRVALTDAEAHADSVPGPTEGRQPRGGHADSGAVSMPGPTERRQPRGGHAGRPLEAARESLEGERAALARHLVALGVDWSADKLLATAPPASDVIAAHQQAFDAIGARRRACVERRRALMEEMAEVQRALDTLRADGEVPSEQALAERRSERDALWASLRMGSLLPLEVAMYECAVLAADVTADRLRREATRVTRAAECEAALGAVRTKLDALAMELAEIEREAAEGASAWTALWAPVGVAARPPVEMSAWAARHGLAAGTAERVVSLERETARLEAAREEARRALARALGVTEDASLAALLAEARERLARDTEAATAHAGATAVLVDIARDRAVLEVDDERLQRAWHAVTATLGLSAGASPEQVDDALAERAGQARRAAEAEAQGRRLATLDSEAAWFEAEVAALCQGCAPDLVALPVDQACAELSRRQRRAAGHQARRDAIAPRERELEGEVAALEAMLATEAPAEAQATVEARAEELGERLAALDERIEHKNRELGSVESGAAQYARSTAVDPAEEAQRHLARVQDLAERYARSRLASAAIARLVERYRRDHQGPVLARASDLFATLTLGSFDGLEVGFGEADEPVIVARREGARLETDALSEGTLDQLYLALRVASLERLASTREPLPLLLDDVLVQFDDPRAAAALGVLGELARRTQVILFTHHQRIVELARGTGEIHQLG